MWSDNDVWEQVITPISEEEAKGNDFGKRKILNRIKLLCIGEEFEHKLNIDPTIIAQKVCSELYDNVTTYFFLFIFYQTRYYYHIFYILKKLQFQIF